MPSVPVPPPPPGPEPAWLATATILDHVPDWPRPDGFTPRAGVDAYALLRTEHVPRPYGAGDPIVWGMLTFLHQGGVLPPILVSGGIQLVDGHHRCSVHHLLGRETIPAVIHDFYKAQRPMPKGPTPTTSTGRVVAVHYGAGSLEARIGDAFAAVASTAGPIEVRPIDGTAPAPSNACCRIAPPPLDERKGLPVDALRAALPDVTREAFEAALVRMIYYQHATSVRVDLRDGGAREFVLRIMEHDAGTPS